MTDQAVTELEEIAVEQSLGAGICISAVGLRFQVDQEMACSALSVRIDKVHELAEVRAVVSRKVQVEIP